jgi:hypothetical protein
LVEARVTRLQEFCAALLDLRVDARDELDDTAFRWFIRIATEVFGLETARLMTGDLIRAERDDVARNRDRGDDRDDRSAVA